MRAVDVTRLSSKGQVVVPKRLRKALNLKPGDNLVIAAENDRMILRKLTFDDVLKDSREDYRRGRTSSHEETFARLRR
ncbi:MAG: AbrB/MazE/SpoVT family DNA-binding domain-containing protein [Nitrospirae bacterium]|nr:AbrB/MazE/SpoVT family DNA-binding domain-containing protein [Nitrospirota bacterium]